MNGYMQRQRQKAEGIKKHLNHQRVDCGGTRCVLLLALSVTPGRRLRLLPHASGTSAQACVVQIEGTAALQANPLVTLMRRALVVGRVGRHAQAAHRYQCYSTQSRL